MQSNTPTIPTTEELKIKWEGFSQEYTSLIESSTLKAAKSFFKKFIALRDQNKLPKTNLKGGEIACGSGKFMEFVLTENPEFLKKIQLFDLTESMTKMTHEKLKNHSEKLDLCVRLESIVIFIILKLRR